MKKNIKYNYIIYIGRSTWKHEFCCLTVGSTRRTIADRETEKGFKAIYTFTKFMTRADAQSIEGHAHTIADKYYKRAPVQMGITKRKGATPNRSGEWWYGKPSKEFIALMLMAITEGYTKRFQIQLKQQPYYKGAVPGLKKSLK